MTDKSYKTIESPLYVTHALKDLLFEDSFIAGGIMRDLMTLELCKDEYSFLKPKMTTKDIDIYFKNDTAYNIANKFTEQELSTSDTYQTDNSTSYMASYKVTKNVKKLFAPNLKHLSLDLVKRDFGTPETILDTFDLTVSQCAFHKNIEDNKYYITMSPEFEKDLKNKHIVLASGKFNDYIVKRVLKYIDYGFTISSHKTLIKILNLFVDKEPEIQKLLLDGGLTVEKLFEMDSDSVLYFFDRLKKYYKREESMPSYEDIYELERAAVDEFYTIVEQLKSDDPNEEIPWEFVFHNIGLNHYEIAVPELNFFQERLLRFLSNQVLAKKISQKDAGTIFDFTYRYDITTQKPAHLATIDSSPINILCRFCNRKMYNCAKSYCSSSFLTHDEDTIYITGEDRYAGENNRFRGAKFNNEAEIVYKTFLMGYDKKTNEINAEWFNNVAEFWLNFKKEQTKNLLSLKEWHDMINNDAFDPLIPFKLLVNFSKIA